MCFEGNGQTDLKIFLQELEYFVNMDTPSGGKAALDVMSGKLRQAFERIGCSVRTHERAGGNILECRAGTGERQILLLGHMDTVFPDGTAAQRPYREQDGRLYGPGVLDMKSGVLMILELFRRFQGKLPSEWSLCALLNADEEVGSPESGELIIQLAKRSEICLCMEPSKPGGCTVARKGIINFHVQARGVAAHSGVNYLLGRSAVESICHITERLYALRDDKASISINIGSLTGGNGKSNVVAEQAGLLGEVRCYKTEQQERLIEKISAICAAPGVPDVETELRFVTRRPPLEQSGTSRALYEMARRAAESNGLPLSARIHGGGSDGSLAAATGIPVLDGLGAEGENSHTANEYVLKHTLAQRVNLCSDLLQMLLENKSERGYEGHE